MTKKFYNENLYPYVRELLEKKGEAIITVKEKSMLPFIKDNKDQVILEKKDFNSLDKGEIIFFKSRWGDYTIGRIYSKSDLGYLTIGDGNLEFDGYVRSKDVLAVVKKIVKMGKQIDCDSYFWKIIFNIWMKLLPMREYLLKIYNLKKLLL